MQTCLPHSLCCYAASISLGLTLASANQLMKNKLVWRRHGQHEKGRESILTLQWRGEGLPSQGGYSVSTVRQMGKAPRVCSHNTYAATIAPRGTTNAKADNAL